MSNLLNNTDQVRASPDNTSGVAATGRGHSSQDVPRSPVIPSVRVFKTSLQHRQKMKAYRDRLRQELDKEENSERKAAYRRTTEKRNTRARLRKVFLANDDDVPAWLQHRLPGRRPEVLTAEVLAEYKKTLDDLPSYSIVPSYAQHSITQELQSPPPAPVTQELQTPPPSPIANMGVPSTHHLLLAEDLEGQGDSQDHHFSDSFLQFSNPNKSPSKSSSSGHHSTPSKSRQSRRKHQKRPQFTEEQI